MAQATANRAVARRFGVDSTPLLQHLIDRAAKSGRAVTIPAGITYVSTLHLPGNVHLVGAGRSSRLVSTGAGPMLTAERAETVVIENVGFEGSGLALGGEHGLVEAHDVADFRFIGCSIDHVAGYGLKLENCGGQVKGSSFRVIAEAALFSTNGSGLSVLDNQIEDCGNNGIQIWRSEKGEDGTVLRGNRISHIRANRGRDGPFGNGINVFCAAGVICENNDVKGCGFSAIRYNASSNALISANTCSDLAEVAIYLEFGSLGAVVQRNFVDGASSGISITNVEPGGRIATCNGNTLRNLGRPNPQRNGIYGIGIQIEEDTVASGNAIDHALIGMRLGFGSVLRNVIASNNVISDCGVGIDVTVVPKTGPASILANTITGAKHGAIVGMEWDKIVVFDLIKNAARYPQLKIADNQVK
ncbi:MAG: TIGR03808 family TAT-translocated repetitive protein [Methylovirgula sp.]